ncbi:hypothetical protein [Spirosoma rhododendri]|uniref:DUF481 domain-containing protein n=1 Tax=Spirosoma rhododendri TaxID=2728024 RepID=A0A7L5DPN4_9BACT|nr:hypothetical protein [Spirosoma rhododendri]QJD80399.1 hypothetical protein HH216_19695 [Spirosoma rhododendri]
MKTVLFCLLLLSAYAASAQSFRISPQDTQRKESFVLMRDGTVLKGQILRQDSSIISVRRRGGDMSFVEADQVVSISDKEPEEMRPAEPANGSYQVFVFRDGTQIEGTFVKRDSTMITVRKRNGRLTYFEPELLLKSDSVSTLTTVPVNKHRNRFPTWMLTGQTAYNPEKGRFYYRNTWLLLNEFTYGITKFWSVSANFVTPIPYLLVRETYAGGGSAYVQNNSSISTRFSAALGQYVHAAVTVSYRQPYGYPQGKGEGTFRGLLTLGSSQNNLTLGYGLVATRARFLIYYNPPYYSSAPPVYSYGIPNRSFLIVGLVQKLSPGLTLISDNQIRLDNVNFYVDTNWKTSLSAALRIDRPRHAFDLGLFGYVNAGEYRVNGKRVNILPYVGYNLLIGKP